MDIDKNKKVLVTLPIVMRKFFDYQRKENYDIIPDEISNIMVSACERMSFIHMSDSNFNFDNIREEFIKEVCDRLFDKSDELVSETGDMKMSRNLLCESIDQVAASCEYFWNSSMNITNKMINEIRF